MMNLGLPKRKTNPNKSENLLDFGFAKNYRSPTTFGFEFELRHIPRKRQRMLTKRKYEALKGTAQDKKD